jgi:hypothetical protein
MFPSIYDRVSAASLVTRLTQLAWDSWDNQETEHTSIFNNCISPQKGIEKSPKWEVMSHQSHSQHHVFSAEHVSVRLDAVHVILPMPFFPTNIIEGLALTVDTFLG